MQSGEVMTGLQGKHFYLQFVGDVRLPWCVTLENHCQNIIATNDIEQVSVDLNSAQNLDSTTLGVLAKVALLVKKGLGTTADLYCLDENIQRLVRSMGFTSIFNIKKEPIKAVPDLLPISFVESEEDDVREAVIDAHRALIDVDEVNRAKFQGLVETLQNGKK
jgi:anti-anti-sigma factor